MHIVIEVDVSSVTQCRDGDGVTGLECTAGQAKEAVATVSGNFAVDFDEGIKAFGGHCDLGTRAAVARGGGAGGRTTVTVEVTGTGDVSRVAGRADRDATGVTCIGS